MIVDLKEMRTLRDVKNLQEIKDAIRPFVEAKKYNPNRSAKMTTTRTMAVRAIDIAVLNALAAKLELLG